MSFAHISITLLTLLLSVANSFDLNSKSNVAVYWGQNSQGAQEPLASYCQSSDADIFLLSFIDVFPTLSLNFANACSETFSDNAGLLHCSQIAADIQTCQSLGKKVILSLGGASGAYGFTDDAEAEIFAQTLWNTFGEGSGVTDRPFDSSIVDGFDFDIENNNNKGYAALVTKLRTLFTTGSKQYYISAAPQCPYPDASVGDLLQNADVDFAFIQFYNNYCNVEAQFNWDAWNNYANTISPNSNIKLFLGLPASAAAAGSGYIADVNTLKATVQSISSSAHFGGISLWDASQAFTNKIDGQNYVQIVKSVLENDQSTITAAVSSSAPVASDPVTSAPVASDPVTSVPVISVPVASDPVTSTPVTSTPVTSDPVTSDPVTSDPVNSDPVISVPVTSVADETTLEPTTSAVVEIISSVEARSITTLSPLTTDYVVATSSSDLLDIADFASTISSEQSTTVDDVAQTLIVAAAETAQDQTAQTTEAQTLAPVAEAQTIEAQTQAPVIETTTQQTTTISQVIDTIYTPTATVVSTAYVNEETTVTTTLCPSETSTVVPTMRDTDSARLVAAAAAVSTESETVAHNIAKQMNAIYASGSYNGKDTCTDGEIACSGEGSFSICDSGKWSDIACAEGTTCYAYDYDHTVLTQCSFTYLRSKFM